MLKRGRPLRFWSWTSTEGRQVGRNLSRVTRNPWGNASEKGWSEASESRQRVQFALQLQKVALRGLLLQFFGRGSSDGTETVRLAEHPLLPPIVRC